MKRLLLTVSLTGFSMLALGGKALDEQSRLNTLAPPSNPTPSALTLTRVEDNIAIIGARFANTEKQDTVTLNISGEQIKLNDTGEDGDQKRGDGIFSIATEFDFEHFQKANEMLAELHRDSNLKPLFSMGARHQSGEQKLQFEGENLIIQRTNNGKSFEQLVPLTIKGFPFGQPIAIPLSGIRFGLLPSLRAATPASIPHSLMITDTNVVEDPDRTWACPTGGTSPIGNETGSWTFWQQMENISNGTASTSDYIKSLFAHWQSIQTINTFGILARPHVYQQIIEAWEIRSGGPGADLLPEHSPFRLLGIVLRADLRSNGSVYSGGDAGEGRFVFSLHDGNCNPMAKTLILEYKVPIASCANVRSWAQDWKALEFSANYNDDLAALTEVFTAAGANPSGPNQSAISQVRTNEFLAGSSLWQLREFVLPDSGGLLGQTTVKQEPDISHNNSLLLANFINANWNDLVGPPAAQHDVTPAHGGMAFLAGAAPAPVLWNAPPGSLTVPTTPSPISAPPATVRDDAVFQLALNTCSGCHSNETGANFAHLHYNTPPGAPAILSGFLTGTSLPDTRNPAITRTFNDLARRADDLDDLAAMACRSTTPVGLGNAVLHALTSPRTLDASH
ncbi:hypothetical protein [Teredinibacter purpureus]|uniref:hypothetical protein n=1 Tax=Teredinibacter purpureus TaxID=2731756 RepID=UPI000B2D9924|nr:hypothetical protein [Teredinibacter purpureus]